VVISGDVVAVERAGALAKEAGARRVLPLSVSGAFHSPLMAVAEEGLREQLAGVELRRPAFPVVSNVTAQPVRAPDEARELLVRQLTSPVRWVASCETMLGGSAGRFLEVGPGNVLSGLLRRVDRQASARAVGTADEVATLLNEEELWN
jgi:[acyl-carrier-protein] S-malonyltransferase